MERQLTLITTARRSWELDEATKEIGRRGIARARAVLAESRRSNPTPGRDTDDPGHHDAA